MPGEPWKGAPPPQGALKAFRLVFKQRFRHQWGFASLFSRTSYTQAVALIWGLLAKLMNLQPEGGPARRGEPRRGARFRPKGRDPVFENDAGIDTSPTF